MVHVANRFQKKLDTRLQKTVQKVSAREAVFLAAKDLNLEVRTSLKTLKKVGGTAQKVIFDKGGISLNNIPVKLVYVPTNDGTLRLTWEVQIYELDAQHYWMSYVDAQTGRVIEKQDMVISCNFDYPEHAHNADCLHGGSHAAFENPESIPSAGTTGFLATKSNAEAFSNGHFYRIYDAPVETPNHGGRTYVFTNGDPVASPYGWHYDGTAHYLVTKGNNVYAYEDTGGGNAGLPAVGGVIPGQSLNFDFPLDLTQDPSTYTDAAITNLFYWNNYIHDVMYHYGFDEVSGNFQVDNLGKGGIGNDAVMAEAQDGGGTNNANFLTLPDGVPGRMQMYLWSSNQPADLVHINHSSTYPNGGVSFTAIPAAFGPEITTTGVNGDLVLIEANVNTSSTCNPCGCGTGQGVGLPPNNDVNGKIVLIKRGDCSFIEKVMGAQMGGAIGVIVYNNIPGAGPLAMGGDETGNLITIPAVMVSYEDGLELKDEIALGTINIDLKRLTPAPPNKDGDLDNGIIAHEYGHGISIRLTGGPGTTCLSGDEQAGEGWSDFFAYMTTMDAATINDGGYAGRGIGTYVFDQPITGNGIRPAKYSRDMNVNNYTYGDLNNAEITVPHGVGFIFATALWDMTWNLIDAYGYDPDLKSGNLNAGNILAMQLVIDGLKLQPCSPTFLESRDAILAADQALTGGANQCLIWEAFAKRGMGYSAVSGTNSRGDETEAFDMPPSCLPDLTIATSSNYSKVANGDVMTYTIELTNTGGQTATGVVVTNPVPVGTNFLSASNGGFVSANTITFPTLSVNPGQTVTLTFDVTVNTPTATTLLFDDNMENGQNKWNATPGADMWALTNSDANSGSFSWFAADPDNASDQTLTLANSLSLPANAELLFTHKYDTEAGFDGGVVEISNDGGTTWYDLGSNMTQNGYSDFIPLANNPLINGFAFGGASNGFITTTTDLNLFKNQNVLIRFRFSSDVATPKVGWWIDDVIIGQDVTLIHSTASFVSPIESGHAGTSAIVVNGPSQAAIGNPNNEVIFDNKIENNQTEISDINLIAYPNPAQDHLNIRLEGILTGKVQIDLVNTQGQVIQSQKFDAESLNQTIEMNTSDLLNGVYFINVQDDQSFGTTRVVIQKN
ncbi:MAG: DUF11 domain-containing protein [Bacteroidetes bacterium]|nr:MAG: DUF11 domain-containing protein [Bacteroidota bacterium]